MTKTLAEMGFAFSSDSNEWYTPEDLILFCEMLAKRFTIDLCGLSPYFKHTPVLCGEASDGLLTFLRWHLMLGASVFCNPPYGYLPAQTLTLSKHDLTTDAVKYLPVLPGKLPSLVYDPDEGTITAESPKTKRNSPAWFMSPDGSHKLSGGLKGEPVVSRVHSAHSYALYLLNLWESGIIRQAVIVIPNATDTLGYNKILKSVGFCLNVVGRVKFLCPKDGELVPGTQNTKGTTIFFLPPHGTKMTPDKLRIKLDMMRSELGGELPIEVAPMFLL